MARVQKKGSLNIYDSVYDDNYQFIYWKSQVIDIRIHCIYRELII